MKNIHFSSKYESYINEFHNSILKNNEDLKYYFESFLKTADLEGLRLFFKIIKSAKIKVKQFLSKEELFDNIKQLFGEDKNLPVIQYLHQQSLFNLKSKEGYDFLEQAIVFNAVKNVIFLLNKNAPTSIKETQITVLHLAIINDNPTIIGELKKDKTLFKPSENGTLPLHIVWAMEDLLNQKKPHIKEELIHKNSNETRIKLNYSKEFLKVSNAKNFATVLIHSHYLLKQERNLFLNKEQNLLNQGAGNYFKAIFEDKVNFKHLIEAKNLLIKYLNLEEVKNEIDKDNFMSVANKAYSYLMEIYKIVKTLNEPPFIKEAEAIFEKIEHPFIKAISYHDIANRNKQKYNPFEALNNIKHAYYWISKIIESGKYTPHMEKIYYLILINRIPLAKRFNSKETVEYIKEAEKVLPPNTYQQELLENKILFYHSIHNIKKLLPLLKQLQNIELREIWENYIKIKSSQNVEHLIDEEYFTKYSGRRVEDFSSLTKFQLYFQTLMEYKIKLGKYDEALKICKDLLHSSPLAQAQFNIILQILDLHKIQGNWIEGYEFLQDSYNKYLIFIEEEVPFELFYYEYFFLENNGHFEEANLKIKKLIQTAKNSNHAYYCAYTALEQIIMNNANQLCFEKIEEKFALFNELLINCPGNNNLKSVEKIKLLKKLVDKLRTNNESNSELNDDVNLNPESYENKKEFYSKIDLLKLSTEELNEAWPYLTPQTIHNFFMEKKQLLASMSISNINETNNLIFSWQTPKDKNYSSNQENIYHFDKKPNAYFYIPDKIFDKLDPIQRKQFKLQISKSLVTKEHSMNGFKLIKVPGTKKIALVEAKINADIRVYGAEAYENSEGKILYVLNKIGNHEKVANAALKPIKVLPVSSLNYEDLQLNNEEIFNNDFDEGNLTHFPLYEDDVSILGDTIYK